jgi:hypothetical protein
MQFVQLSRVEHWAQFLLKHFTVQLLPPAESWNPSLQTAQVDVSEHKRQLEMLQMGEHWYDETGVNPTLQVWHVM